MILQFILSSFFWFIVVMIGSTLSAFMGGSPNAPAYRGHITEFFTIFIPFLLIAGYKVFSVYTHKLPITTSLLDFLLIIVLPLLLVFVSVRGPSWMFTYVVIPVVAVLLYLHFKK